jgi:branched-chain amino acid transport system permease protein
MYLYPAAGTEVTMIAIVVTIFAGLGRVRAILFGGWLLGLTQSAAVFTLGSKWRELVSAALLILLLYFRPEGISRKKES